VTIVLIVLPIVLATFIQRYFVSGVTARLGQG